MENIKKFSEMNIKNEIKKAIENMGFEEATPIQSMAIPYGLEGKDIIGIAQTGTGKTCAFSVPVIQKIDVKSPNVQALILCPTRELVIQICEEMQNIGDNVSGLKIVPIYGGQSIDKQITSLKRKPQIVVGTPGRIMDHMRRRTINFEDINMFVLDEADEMLDMGFREDLDTILKKANSNKQTLLFSATMSKDILAITKKFLKKDAIKVQIENKTLTAPSIEQYVIKTESKNKTEVLSRILDVKDINLAVIFCNTKRKVDELDEQLRIRGYQVGSIHGDMKQTQRDVVMKKFKSGKINILIATDVAARGIDVDNVEVIFNYDIPLDEEYYVHRIGRTGRAGKTGISITFCSAKEQYKIRHIEKYTNVDMIDYEVPTVKFANEKKINNLLDKVTKQIENSDLTQEIEIIDKYLENIETSPIEIAAVLLKLKLNMYKKEETTTNSNNISSSKVRLFITIGKLDNLRRKDLKEYVIAKTGVSRDDIYDVEVLDKFSFVTVSNDVYLDIIGKLDNTTYNNRRVAIEVSTGKSQKRK